LGNLSRDIKLFSCQFLSVSLSQSVPGTLQQIGVRVEGVDVAECRFPQVQGPQGQVFVLGVEGNGTLYDFYYCTVTLNSRVLSLVKSICMAPEWFSNGRALSFTLQSGFSLRKIHSKGVLPVYRNWRTAIAGRMLWLRFAQARALCCERNAWIVFATNSSIASVNAG
jgi:hypothetical protein